MRGMMLLAFPAMMWLAGCGGGKDDCTCTECDDALALCADDAQDCVDAAVALCGTGDTAAAR